MLLSTLLIIIAALLYITTNLTGKPSFIFRGPNNVTVILNFSMPEFPSDIVLLKIDKLNYSEAEAIHIARNLFNLTGELSVRYLNWGIAVGNGTHTVEF